MNDDKQAIREINAVSSGDEVHVILHYLYVPSNEVANQISKDLKQRGFQVEERLGADCENWLVLAKHNAVPTEELIASVRQSLEEMMDSVGGEYDGWEAEMPDRDGNPPRLQ
ncbi:regulator of ribonuclease activity B [Tahibacter aquaticus]|jgi:regulator of RNase E activity RraB|uniref:Regulator of ribonuclease activity B n=1 Tax=Tahibacter aquaticus TaxID=520092 RepID=A0A4R6YE58_9GAMM|nr:ribonuclease E inhibitor RraB [Tahibacter aquaticus]TDR34364.1 regulator of ribonuclease activity B [Tahibacter aquaticus]